MVAPSPPFNPPFPIPFLVLLHEPDGSEEERAGYRHTDRDGLNVASAARGARGKTLILFEHGSIAT